MMDYPEYLVLAEKNDQKTYEMCEVLEDAYDAADNLKTDGWKISEILNVSYKSQHAEDYEYVVYLIKRECEKVDSRNITKRGLKEVKDNIIRTLFDMNIDVDSIEDYIDFKIKSSIGWNDLSEIVTDYAIEHLKGKG